MSIENAQITYVESFEDVQNYFRWLSEKRTWLAWDTETEGLEHWKNKLRLFQFGDPDNAWVFRFDRWAGVLTETLNNYEGNIVGHNLGFDARFYEYHTGEKFPWSKGFDTMTMAHNIDPTKSKALKTLGAQFLSPEAKKLQTALNSAMKQQGWGWDTVPYDFPIYHGYAGVDVLLTSRLAEQLWPQIEKDYLNVFNLEMQVSRICSNMEIRGINLDLNYVEQSYEKLTNYCKLFEETFWNNFNMLPTQNDKVAQLLIDQGAQLSKLTATGRVSMDEEALSGVEHPLAKQLIEYRKAKKIANTYFKNFLEMHHNGIIHPSINTLGARTARMSVQSPAAQTFPRGSIVRDAFLPSSGNGWVSVDYDAVEMRLLAHFCQDPGMLDAIRNGDIHTEMAKIAYQDDTINKKDKRRQTFKNANFAKAYVAGVEKFAKTAEIPVSEAKAFLDMYDRIFPGVKAFQKKVERVGSQRLVESGRAWVKSPIGRIHYAEKSKIYTLINSLIQGTAADSFKQSLVDLDNAGFGPYLTLPVHDEANLDLPLDVIASGGIKEVEEIMTQKNWSVPLTVSASGPFERWGDKERVG